MATRRRLRLLIPILLPAAACDRPQQESAPVPERTPESAQGGGAAPGAGVSLALLEPSNDTLMAALEGVLQTEGRCLYIVGDDRRRSRTLPAFHIAGISWDEASRTLRVRGKAFALGRRVVLGGGAPSNPAALDWVQPPDPSCDASDLFMAGTVDSAEPSAR